MDDLTKLSDIELILIHQSLVYTYTNWTYLYEQGKAPPGWTLDTCYVLIEMLEELMEKWEDSFGLSREGGVIQDEGEVEPEEQPLPNNVLSFPGAKKDETS